MSRAGAVLLFVIGAIVSIATIPFWPEMAWQAYLLIACAGMICAWLVFHMGIKGAKVRISKGETTTIDGELPHYLADILIFFGFLAFRAYKKVAGVIIERRKRREAEAQVKPREQATSTLGIRKIHSGLARKPSHVLIGYQPSGKPVTVDLMSAHTLLGASTKGGKTNLLCSILAQLLLKPQRMKGYIIDLKGNPEDRLNLFEPFWPYVREEAEATELLARIRWSMETRNRSGIREPPIFVIIDEVGDLTSFTENPEYRHQAQGMLTVLARQARSAGITLIVTTQYPHYANISKLITNNFVRRICLAVVSEAQLRLTLQELPKRKPRLPEHPGEFVLRDGLKFYSGRTLLVRPGEVEQIVDAQLRDFPEPELNLWREIAYGREVGESVPGMDATFQSLREHPWCNQTWVREAYRNFAEMGVLNAPGGRGKRTTLGMPFIKGISVIRKYNQEALWKAAPPPMREE